MDRLTAMNAFVRVVELGSFSAAAADLRVEQSTVSKWIAALEDELAARLIDRTTRQRRVTEAGQRFYQRAREIATSYAAAAAEVQDDERPRGRLRVSAPVVFGRLFVVPAAVRFLRRYPEVELDLRMSDRYVDLVEGGFDLAVRVGAPLDSSLRARTLARSRRHLVATPRYLARCGTPERPRQLSVHACLVHSGLAPGSPWVFRRGSRTQRVRVSARFAADNSEALLAMARASLGVAVLADWLVARDLERGRLVSLLPEYELPAAPVQALSAPGRRATPTVRAFADVLADFLAARRA
ncbi:LysR family transcriptional regulator [Haliangium ochraceum]|uniref:Transcriptional regulator, LysR family n=1 Tax=Haliangium ochraceum (strain DSM 14365 / JCM 11303 / SMP-2) TaxID=502025 RepID=D0LVR7_HALO1|nr:LysR family transcriptional regulator [Haliangium ochraceum]ACY14051.1 transcriptional regulator, LysR family [Haliangium ochraceum DSM 14365]